MQMMQNTTRVPMFFFKEVEDGEDAAASAELGYPVPKMITRIYVTPHGAKEPLEFAADEWIKRKDTESRQQLYDPSWVKAFKDGLALYRQGKEIPRTGTPIITWERVSKSRREQLAAKYSVLEDLAAVPDSALNQIGLDGRVIRDLARGDIQSKKDLSPVVKELADANETIRRQAEILERLSERLEALESEAKPGKKIKA